MISIRFSILLRFFFVFKTTDVHHEHVDGSNNMYFCGIRVFGFLASVPKQICKHNNFNVSFE